MRAFFGCWGTGGFGRSVRNWRGVVCKYHAEDGSRSVTQADVWGSTCTFRAEYSIIFHALGSPPGFVMVRLFTENPIMVIIYKKTKCLSSLVFLLLFLLTICWYCYINTNLTQPIISYFTHNTSRRVFKATFSTDCGTSPVWRSLLSLSLLLPFSTLN